MTLHLYFLYSEKDHAAIDLFQVRLVTALRLKSRPYKVEHLWFSDQISDESTLSTYLAEPDVLVPVLTPNFLTSNLYISDVFQRLIPLDETGDVIIMPMLAKPCYWPQTKLSKTDVVPLGGLPILEEGVYQAHLEVNLVEKITEALDRISARRKVEESRYRHYLEEGDRIYPNDHSNDEKLLESLAFFKKALTLHRSDYIPLREVLETKIAICQREIDFHHYASAAENALEDFDYRGVLYHAKDALKERDDARMRELVRLSEESLERMRREEMAVPFAAHVNAGDLSLISLDWKNALMEYELALNYIHPAASDEVAVIREKISICHREKTAGQLTKEARKAFLQYDYANSLALLDAAKKVWQHEISALADEISNVLEILLNVEKFRDEATLLWGFYNRKDNIVVIPAKYEEVYSFTEGLAAVRLGGLWGFVNIYNELVIPHIYTHASHFRGGKAEVFEGKTAKTIQLPSRLKID